MPLYEYKCSDCKTKFDFLHKSTKDQLDVHCPICGSIKNKKLFSSFSSATKNESNLSGSCENESCGLPAAGCPSGLCGLN
jgi:putative FmdB family regulatory protein